MAASPDRIRLHPDSPGRQRDTMTIGYSRSRRSARVGRVARLYGLAAMTAVLLGVTQFAVTAPPPAPAPAPVSVLTVNDTATGGTVGVAYAGSWLTSNGSGKYHGDDHYSNSRGATVTVTFTGTGARLFGARASWHGVAGISVDGEAEKWVDSYSATRQDQALLFAADNLVPGNHRITVRVTGDRNSRSGGTVVAFDRVDVTVPATVVSSTAGFVSRRGNQLTLGGATFRFAGANLYWLGLDDNIRDSGGLPTYPTKARIDNGLKAAVAAGFTVIRSHTLGISVGCSRCLEPSRGNFNDAALESADYALYRAGQLGLKVMIPLVDQWRWYHGGISTFTGWRGYPNAGSPDDNVVNAANNSTQRASEANFYTDANVIADYKQYISHLLNHINPYTGLAYKNDPAVMAWETGNEIWTANPTWTQNIAAYLKHTVGAKQLVADGTAASGMLVANAAVNGADVDILGGHFYPIDTAWATQDAGVAAAHGKAYIIGEFAWTDRTATGELTAAVQGNANIAGDLLWTLMPYQENGQPEPHGDGYAFYNPATSPTMSAILAILIRHSAAMSRR